MLFRKNKEEQAKHDAPERKDSKERSLTSATGEYEAVDAALEECAKDTQKTERTAQRISSRIRSIVMRKD